MSYISTLLQIYIVTTPIISGIAALYAGFDYDTIPMIMIGSVIAPPFIATQYLIFKFGGG
jgi:hypothetical protein